MEMVSAVLFSFADLKGSRRNVTNTLFIYKRDEEREREGERDLSLNTMHVFKGVALLLLMLM